MHALTVWPSASDHSLSSGSSNWGRCRGKGFHGVLYKLSYSRGCRSEASLTAPNCKLKHGLFSSRRRGAVDLLSKRKKKPFGLAFALQRPLNEPIVGKHGVEVTHVHKPNPVNEDDIGQNDGISQGANGRSKTWKKIDVRKLALSLHSAETVDDVEAALKKKAPLPLQVYSTIIRAFGEEKRLVSAMALFKWLKQKSKDADAPIRPNIYIFNHLLGAMKQAEKFDAVEEVIDEIDAVGVLPNVITYNTLMSIYIEQGREIEALQLFEEMQSKRVSPSPASYSTVLSAYRRLEDGFGALAFFVKIRTKYHKGELRKDAVQDWDYQFARLENFTLCICYQVMRRWLVTSVNLSTQILKLLKDMDEAGLKHGCAELEHLLWACTHAEHHVVAKEVYTRMREVDIEISLSVCNHVIWLMGKAKKWWVALEILRGNVG